MKLSCYEVERLRAAMEAVKAARVPLCTNSHHKPFRFPGCPACGLEARLDEIDAALEAPRDPR